MNNKTIAGLAVVVALLSGWLVIAQLNQPKVSLKSESTPKPIERSVRQAPTINKNLVNGGEEASVKSKVEIKDNNVSTTVKVK